MSSKVWKLIGFALVLILDPYLGRGQSTKKALREIRSLGLDSRRRRGTLLAELN